MSLGRPTQLERAHRERCIHTNVNLRLLDGYSPTLIQSTIDDTETTGQCLARVNSDTLHQ
jgi:hypothetical protein